QLRQIYKKRLRRKVDPGVFSALYALPFAVTAVILAIILQFAVTQAISVPIVFYIVIFGWISLTILSFLYKIIPFLWWTHKYGSVIGKEKTPQLKDMISEKRGRWWLTGLYFCI